MLSLMLAAALMAPPAGTYTYTSSLNGEKVGTTTITLTTAPAGGQHIDEKASGSYAGQTGTLADTLTLDATLAPASYTSSATMGARTMSSTLSFGPNGATETAEGQNKAFPLAGNAKHFVVLDVGPFSGWFALPAQLHAWGMAPVMALVPGVAQAYPITALAQTTTARPASVPGADAVIAVGSPLAFTLWYDPATLLVDELDVPAQAVTVTRSR